MFKIFKFQDVSIQNFHKLSTTTHWKQYLAIAEDETVRFLAIISSNSTSLNPEDGGGYPGAAPEAKNAGFTWA